MGKRISLGKAWNHVDHSVEVDEDGFTYIEHTSTEVEDEILDECARLRGLQQNVGSNFKFAGKVPTNTHAVWKKEWRETAADNVTWPTFLAIKMNNRDHSKLKILDGKLPTTMNRRMI